MPMRLPGPMREIIDLLSSPPLSRHSPAPTTIRKFEDPFMSSPLPPSPSAMFSAFAERAKAAAIVREVQESKEKEKASIWDIPDDPREVELPPPPPPPPAPATKNKRDPKTTAPAGAKIPRARKVTEKSKVEKKAPLGNGKIKARVIKSSLEAVTKSKYFSEKQQPKSREHPPDVLTALNLSSENTALAPKSPNQGPHPEPPLHVTRRQWTPVKNTVLLSSSSPSLANGELKITKIAAFSNMIHAMRYSTEPPEKSQEVSVSLENRVENVLIRKRAIEMISPPNSAATTGPPILKLKAPKQKRKTITDQATASYRTATNSPLLQNCLKHQTSLITKDRNPRKPPSRKPGSPAKKKHKSGTETIILLSPTGAQKRFDSQEFVFGTCSQLERTPEDEAGPAYDSQPIIEFDNQNDNYYDESLPSSTSVARRGFLKTLAKNRKGGSLFKEDSWEMKNRLVAGYDVSAAGVQEQPARQRESQPSKLQGTSGMLWDAAAQDPDGGVLDVEFLDMTGSDNGDSGYLESNSTRLKGNGDLLRGGTTTMETAAIGRLATQNDAEESCQSIGREPQIAEVTAAARENDPFQTTRGPRNNSQAIRFEPTSALLLVTPHTTNPVPARVTGDSSRSISSSATAPSVAPVERQPNLPNPPNPVLNSVALKSKKSKQPKPAPVMPDFQSYQVTMLKAEIAKFGFKNMKTKDRMVSCLERCWEAQNKAATVAAQSAAQPEANDSRSVANTTELPQRVMNKEETVSALHSQDNPALLASKKPRASTKQKKTGKEKATSKSPKRKAAPKRRARSPKVVTQSENVNFGTLGFTDLSAEPSSLKRNYTPKVSTRKASAPPSPKSVAFNTTQRHYRISKVVRESSGRTGSKFSFYHSILMYDPIILEDMTSWLNLTFQNEKVDVEAVKAWCEANGVCCVRSESLRTKRRKR